MTEFINTTFNNREIAACIWLLIATVAALASSSIRKSVLGVAKAIFNVSVLTLFGTLALYTALLCGILSTFYVWTLDQIPQTVVWYLFSGVMLLGRSLQAKEDDKYFKKIILDAVKLAGIFEFLIAAHSFSLFVELVFFPVMALLGGMLAVSQSKNEHASVQRLIEIVLVLIVVGLLWFSVTQVWAAPGHFFTTEVGRDFLLPILLSIGCIPAFYVWYCISHLQLAAIRVNMKAFQSDELKQYAKQKFFLTFMASPPLLNRAVRQFHNMPATNNSDVQTIISDILEYEKHSKNPPVVDPSIGWSPYIARLFLYSEKIVLCDYHKGYVDDKWWAISSVKDLDDEILPNTVTYSIKGNREVAKELKLKGYFNNDFNPENAIDEFLRIATALITAALSTSFRDAKLLLESVESVDITTDNTRIRLWTEPFPSGKGFEKVLTLSR